MIDFFRADDVSMQNHVQGVGRAAKDRQAKNPIRTVYICLKGDYNHKPMVGK